MMSKKIIYIAGKVTGDDYKVVVRKFSRAARILRNRGFIVINPIEVVNDINCTWDTAMRKCISALMTANAVYLLPDWKNSKGARFEVEVCSVLDIPYFSKYDDLLKYAGKLAKNKCGHTRVSRVLMSAAAGCETTVLRCLDCSSDLEAPQVEC